MKTNSSVLHSLAYERSTQELTVVFMDGTAYRYSGVPEHTYQSLLLASSKGRFFNHEIRGRYPFEKTVPEASSLS